MGETLEVLVEGIDEDEGGAGRPMARAGARDRRARVPRSRCAGEIVSARVVEALGYDMEAEVSEMSDNQMTAANRVTLTRIILIPVFLLVLLTDWPKLFPGAPMLAELRPWIAAIVFIVLAATDSVDGYLARSRNEVTTFGKFLDPLADKLLVTAALLALVELQVLPAWIAFIILAREFIVSGLRMVASAEGLVIAASWYGKIKTVTQIVAIVMFLVKDSAFIASLGPADRGVLPGGVVAGDGRGGDAHDRLDGRLLPPRLQGHRRTVVVRRVMSVARPPRSSPSVPSSPRA